MFAFEFLPTLPPHLVKEFSFRWSSAQGGMRLVRLKRGAGSTDSFQAFGLTFFASSRLFKECQGLRCRELLAIVGMRLVRLVSIARVLQGERFTAPLFL